MKIMATELLQEFLHTQLSQNATNYSWWVGGAVVWVWCLVSALYVAAFTVALILNDKERETCGSANLCCVGFFFVFFSTVLIC